MADASSPSPEQTILRDRLAIDRTVLANERTLLSYIRTALGFLALGVTAFELWDSTLARAAGAAALVLSLVLLFVGLKRFQDMRRRTQRIDL